jgi:hypothetical protein
MSVSLESMPINNSAPSTMEPPLSIIHNTDLHVRRGAFDAIRLAEAMEPSFAGQLPGIYANCCNTGGGTCCGCSSGGACRGASIPSLRLTE